MTPCLREVVVVKKKSGRGVREEGKDEGDEEGVIANLFYYYTGGRR